jgi:hypothetical protein
MNNRRVESFLLRIVVTEEQAQSPEQWRGRIQHVASGIEQQVDALSEAIAFISSHLATICDLDIEVEAVEITPASLQQS